ncbi:MAG: trehalose-6-phosphate synthase, partial [Dehalococcoidia bacterium]|nr:trehalose-6-phosphate synthase [Dehalococcoidia bacterium]
MRLVIVSNRLPFTIKEDRGELTFAPSDGGLANGLRAYLDALPDTANDITDYLWIGWPGTALDDAAKARLAPMVEERRAKMVHLTADQIESFYHGFCNATIWPLFHYFVSFAKFEDSQWEEYRAINEVFADAVAAVLQPNDVVWVHDYHLMLLPRLLRERFPHQSIGFFLHIPFPSVEVFRLLPTDWRRALLEGMLGADLVGFHTDEYVQHFEDSLQRVLSCDVQNHQVQCVGYSARIAAHPMGIDYLRFAEATRDDPEVTAERERLLGLLNGRRMILSLDRLDYTKGILHRLHAYRTFLEENPDRRGSIVLLLNVVPSRGVVADYRVFKQQLEQLVSTINGEYGTLEWTPILYQYRAVPQSALIALYSVAD